MLLPGLAGVALAAAQTPPPAATLRETFDKTASQLRAARAGKPCDNTRGGIAWGNAYELDSYLEMFETTGDRAYLDHFVALADKVVAARADKLGQPDFRGWLRRGWLTGGKYTWGMPTVLLDAAGAPSLELLTSLNSGNDQLAIEVIPGEGDKFSIIVRDSKTRETPGQWHEVTMADVEARINPAPGKTGPLHVRRLGSRPPVAYAPFTPPTAKLVLHGHHTGRIIAPLARFAAAIKLHPELAALGEKAAQYLQCAEETIPELEQSWVDLGDHGYYIFERGIPFWCDGVPEPHNTLASTGSAFLWLADVTGNPLYHRRAEQLARFIKGNLEPLPDGTWMFYYWFGPIHDGWKAQDHISMRTPVLAGRKTPEDLSHLQLTVRFMSECVDRNMVFTRDDLVRFARTFNERLYVETPEGGVLYNSIAGSKSEGKRGSFDANIYGFMLLGTVDLKLFERCRSIYAQHAGTKGQASTLYGWAVLNHVDQILAARKN